ncbi:hypothetical protein HUO09_06965 [Vibrio sp. Y2-5]|uniref:hypothetical protein n=1 Tax=Vibrio sp. Y2-5 TaxID=2743977 RepID=UPI0016601858|nr:hypothetical protein [Vibrio sp. Y2-5]MBD0786078.1 hypothetical protein [Vibrio sp. Y2-5]
MWKWLVILFWSGGALAAHPNFLLPFISGDQRWPTQLELRQTGAWLECSEDIFVTSWCGDEFNYYTLKVWPEATGEQEGEIQTFTLHSSYSTNDWSLFQLNLRKDGFQLQSIQLGEELFSIRDRLKTASTREVDKALVLFINRHAQSFPKILDWQKGNVLAQLVTDGKNVDVQFTRSE